MKRQTEKFFTALLKIFYRKIQVYVAENVPPGDGMVIVMNHPNGLIDPLLIISTSQRPVSFLAKSTLFEAPVLGWIVRRFEAIPIYRKIDGAEIAQNEQTFRHAGDLLRKGGALALFPEGTSHSDPKMKVLKSGVSRIVLGAVGRSQRVWVVPVGLYYTDKRMFRSSALVIWGQPVAVEAGSPDSPSDVRRLTEQIRVALSELVLEADDHRTLRYFEYAERIWNLKQGLPQEEDLWKRWAVQREVQKTWEELKARDPLALARLEEDIQRFIGLLQLHGWTELPTRDVARWSRQETIDLVTTSLFVPIYIIGTLFFYVPYILVGMTARKFAAKEDDILSTIKVLSSLLYFPLYVLLVSWAYGYFVAIWQGILILLLAPAIGWVALRWKERIQRLRDRLRYQYYRIFRRDVFRQVLNHFELIHQQMSFLREKLDPSNQR